MKKLLLAVLLLTSTQILAAEVKQESMCDVMEKLARKVMTIRQDKTMSLKDTLNVMTTKILKEITLLAWETHSYSTAKMQQKKISEFADNVYLQCLKASKS